MRKLDIIAYDVEIVKAIPAPGEDAIPGIDYAGGWTDYLGMGVAVVCALDLMNARTHVFLADNLGDFARLIKGRKVAGFNSRRFDDPLMRAHGIDVTTDYDLKSEVQSAAPKGKGRTLDALTKANLGPGTEKEIAGKMAPVLWQMGEQGKVIDYCIGDVFRLGKLLMRVPNIIDPVTGQTLHVRPVPEPEPATLFETTAP